MKRIISKYIRKRRHIKYLELFIISLKWEIVNTSLAASASQWNDEVVTSLNNNARLIRKYERRILLLRF